MYWFEEQSPLHPVVLSTRVRFARNLAHLPFPEKASPEQKKVVCQKAAEAFPGYTRFDFEKLSPYEKNAYVEAHLCSPQFAREEGQGKQLYVSTDGAVSIMINEEDHFRIQALCQGLNPQKAFSLADEADNALMARASLAFDKRLGFLTACPTNLGCAMRVSAMLHLPALKAAGEINALARAADRLGFTLRGAFGEGSEAQGDLYQISNKSSARGTEQEILSSFEKVIKEICEREQEKRTLWQKQSPDALEDKLWRSFGILSHARTVDYTEFVTRWSDLRLGQALEAFPASLPLDRLLVELMPARLCLEDMSAQDPQNRDRLRATKLRQLLKQ